MPIVFELVNNIKKDQTRSIVSPPIAVDTIPELVFLRFEDNDLIVLEDNAGFLKAE